MSPSRTPGVPGDRSALLAILVHGGPQSVEAIRARELSAGLPACQVVVLTREGSRLACGLAWHRQLRALRPDLIYVVNTAFPGALLAPWWTHRHRVPFVLDTGDVVYEMARASGVESAWKLPLLRMVENRALACAATIVVRGSRHRDYLRSLGCARVELIRDGYVEHAPVAADAASALRRRLGLPDAFVVGVLGSLVFSPRLKICYGWDLIGALARLRDLPVHGLIVGDGDGLNWLHEQARAAGVLERLTFGGRVPYAEVPLALHLMDIALSTQTNNLPGQVRTTGKLPEYMAAGRYILASRVGDATVLLPEPMLVDFNGPVDHEYPARLAVRIREVLANPGRHRLAAELPARARSLCSYDVLRREFARVIAGLEPGFRADPPKPWVRAQTMKLAIVVHDFDAGLGQGRYAIELARRWAPAHTVDVYANTFSMAPAPGWTFVRVPAWRKSSLVSIFSFLAQAEPRIRRRRYDIVHAQGLSCWSADVITAHVCNAARARISPPKNLRSRVFHALVNPVEGCFYRQRRARHLIAISRHVGDEVAKYYGWRRPVTVIPHGIDTDNFRPPRDAAEKVACRERFGLPIESDGAVWLFVGEATKGLAEAILQLPDFPKARLLAISRSTKTTFKRLAETIGVADRFHFRGPEMDLAPAYRAADLFVYPSAYDTFGMVVAEAMASGLAVLVGKEVGAAEWIEPGVSGLLVDPTRPETLRDALDRLRTEPGLAAKLALGARTVALSLTWDRCAAATLQVFHSTVASPA